MAKVTAHKADARSKEGGVRMVLRFSPEEAKLFPLGLAQIAANMELCIKEHLLTGHQSSRTFDPHKLEAAE